jgi:predicted metal-dependent phosphoesterase TrpH
LIDLHLHTTASDGTLTPRALVSRAAAEGLRVIAITDHDTLDGLSDAHAAAVACGIRLIEGVEITAVEGGRDVHMLGYFVDVANRDLREFLSAQRADRLRRVRDIGDRLAALGCPIDLTSLLDDGMRNPSRSIGRPQIAAALVAAGHARDRDDAFNRLIGNDRPAYVPRRGPLPDDVIELVDRAGGIVSMAHPGLTRKDEIIPRLASRGLAALEARHSDHDAAAEAHYRALAASHRLAVSGGSDYHGDHGHRANRLGAVVLSFDELAALESRRR